MSERRLYTCPPTPDVNRIRTIHVTDDDSLPAAIEPLRVCDYVALDTEFMRERTYFPRLCLIQVANVAGCVLVDPLAVSRLECLTQLLADRGRMKVLHAARQDLEVLRLTLGFVPAPVFDTQVAAGLLGMPGQIGYGELVRRCLGDELVKGHARTDWARRPLSDEQLTYAADDVRYLVPLHAELCRRLESAGRLEWLFEETMLLEAPGLYETLPEDAWQRLKGLDRLRPEQRRVARSLAAWRERRARESDKPRTWILSDTVLRGLSERLPATRDALGAVPGLAPGLARKRGAELLELVATAVGVREADDEPTRPVRPDPELVQRVGELMHVVRATAEELSISQELLATRRDVERLVYSGDAGGLARGWRRDVIGHRLLDATGRD